ncbi:MAG: cyclic beta 1-2 glucan synthetase, partial [Deltaproteobacteria bacterium]|nr:cyclic beta 1-2 glucan synthetase [Deltaproteobacteria bacterium]
MKPSGKPILANLLHAGANLRGRGSAKKYAGDEAPLRSELFSSEQMKQHGKTLAGSHKPGPGGIRDRLLVRLAENERILKGACTLLTSAVDANRRIAPAGEWLLDNFYLIEEQIRTAKRHLPKGYSRELPRLLDGPSAGLPRVYDIAHEAISHGDGRVDPESLRSFVASYQTVTVLTLGELWAIPIMLRLALIENLRRVGARIVTGSVDRDLAARWAEQMVEIAEKDPKSLILLTADMARSNPPMAGSFVAEFARRLQGQSTALALPLTWIEQRLSESGLTIEQLVRSENRQKAADQVSISNSIGSLRFLGAMDWRVFVETMSVVDQVLREDPGGAYGRMDFSSRDRYRHVIEKIAKRSRLHEADVARQAILLAGEGADGYGPADRAAHVGFYLVDKGLPRMERAAGVRLTVLDSLRRTASRCSLHLYSGSIMLLTVVVSWALLAKAHSGGLHGWLLALFGALCLLCASPLAVALVNWISTLLVKPDPLPRMDFSEGIPPESRTLVVVPTMLASTRGIESLVESLEVRFLANRDENLYFGLLTDFLDADEETTPGDEELVQLARKGIEDLNDKYGSATSGSFFLFHRPRRWNPQERTWMGYERKRGKLAELNLLLRGGAPGCFSILVGRTADLSNVRFVIPLDTDTQLPRDSARQFVGAMSHPLNRPRYDERLERVSEGHGILQPRMADSLSGKNRSRYARLFGSEPGIDPYTRAVSDVYQDVFDEGSFIGKGIYDVDAFERALKERLPENRILS